MQKTKHRQVEHKCSAIRKVTVKLSGWPHEVRQFSIVEAYWYVELQFEVGRTILKHTVSETTDYEQALIKYDAFVKIVQP